MSNSEAPEVARSALRASLIYFVLAAAWILASDHLVEALVAEPARASLQTYKGWAFIAVTAVLLYLALRTVPAKPVTGASADAERRKLYGQVFAVSILLATTVLGHFAVTAWTSRKALIEDVERQTRDLARILEEQTAAWLNAADLALHMFDTPDLMQSRAGGQEAINAHIRNMLNLMPLMRNLVILDASGKVWYENNPSPGLLTDLSSREFFRHHRDDPSPELYVSQPFYGARTGNLVFVVSRRLFSADNKFAGVVSSAIDIGQLEKLYGTLSSPYDRSVSLARRDGMVLVRVPRVEGVVGRSFAAIPLYSQYLPRAESGTYRTAGAGDGVQRIFSYRGVANRPLVVVLGLDEAQVLSSWQRETAAYGAITGAVILTIAWLTFLVCREIQGRDAVGAALRESEERFRQVWQTSIDVVLIWDSHNIICYANPATRRILGHEPASLMGQNLSMLQPAAPAASHATGITPFVDPNPKSVHPTTVETVVRHRDGHEFPVEIAFSELQFHGERMFAGIVRDITMRKRNHDALEEGQARMRALSDQLLQVQETERATLANELHDAFGQMLTALKLQLQLQVRDQPSTRLDDCIALVDQSLRQVRSLSLDLRPPQLADLGLASALRAHLERLSAQTGRLITFKMPQEVPVLLGARAVAGFRIVQEAVNNALRHAGPCPIHVELNCHASQLELTVQDQGNGFDLAEQRARAVLGRSLGLLSMEERARMVGGTLDIESAIGAGTLVRLRMPLQPADPQGRAG